MPTTDETGGTRATLFVRGSLPKPAMQCRQKIITRLDQLASDGVLDDYSVTSWEKRFPIETDAATLERDRYNEFAAWAEERDVRLTPFFDTRDCYSMQSGEKRTELVMPAICIAVYDDGELETVAPHTDHGSSMTVSDCLDRLRDQRSEETQQRTTLTAD